MNIIMITEKDAANASLSRICHAYLNRGHNITVYALYMSENTLRFFDKRVEIYPFEKLTKAIVDKCDLIFATTMAGWYVTYREILSANKPIFTHTYLINKQMQWGGDLCFVPSLPTTVAEYNNFANTARIEIGEPKYDTVKHAQVESNQLLLIDSGHYPFGMEGKKTLANTILGICKDFPDYEFIIKPRFLPSDIVITHRNSVHLYDVIKLQSGGNIPDNLVMLTEHRDLMELIEESHTVICMHTTAFVGAYVAGKGLVVLDGLPSDDVYDMRQKVSERLLEHMDGSKALINYKNVNELLPDGARCTEEYFRYLLAEKKDVADKICEVTEYLYENFYSKGLFPRYTDCSYSDFKEKIQVDDTMSWKDIIKNRCVGYLSLKMLGLIDFHVNAYLNIRIIKNCIEEFKAQEDVSEALLAAEIQKATIYRDECIVDNADKMLEDDIDSGILLNAYYLLRKYDEIRNFPKKHIGAYHMYRGFVAYEQDLDYELARLELQKYMECSMERAYIKEVSDGINNRIKAGYILVCLLIQNDEYERAKYYFKWMQSYYKSFYRVQNVTENISDRLQGQIFTCIHWLKGKLENADEKIDNILLNKKVLLYGFGVISKRIIMKNNHVKEKIVGVIDKAIGTDEVMGIPVVSIDNIGTVKDADTIIVAVPHLFNEIKQMLREKYPNHNILSINELF